MFAGGSGCCDNNGHVHDCGVDHPEHAHHGNKDNRRLTVTGVVSFLVLCFPIALAAVISPDSFGESFLRNRGVVQTIQQPDKTALAAAQSSAASSNDVALEQKVFVSDQNSQQALGNERVDAKSVGPASAEPTLPSSEEVSANDNASSNEQDEEDENRALPPDREGNIHAEVIDLLYACEDPSIRKDFDGKQVAMIGQVAHRNNARHERGPFQLVRFLMVCCAADVQPVAVMIQYPKSSSDFASMSWVKVVGRVRFQNVGNHLEPAVEASKLISIAQPTDQYFY